MKNPLRPKALASILLGFLMVASVAVPAHAAVVEPRLQLFGTRDHLRLVRYGKRSPVSLNLQMRMASRNAPFELLARRTDYTTPPALWQVLHGPNGETEQVALDPALMNGWLGLKDFFEVTFRDLEGNIVRTKLLPFCPGSYERERLSDAGPQIPTYASGCYANPFTRGVRWGIDEDWTVGTSDEYGVGSYVRLPDGSYTVSVGIADTYLQLFDIDPEMASVEMTARVRTQTNVCRHEPCGGRPHAHSAQEYRPYAAVPIMENPDPSILPDLMSLPSWGIGVNNRRSGSFLSFAANVWTGGASDLVVEGFRREDEAVMDAYQYFYEDGQVVGKALAGEMDYDTRRGHNHWHFKQFAGYSLLTADQSEAVRSTKEAFCLASTDAIDLTLRGAKLDAYTGLGTQCGSASSIWVREVLPLGWGDTYHQGLPGQSFDITDLPNGTYYIKVEANPGRLLHEQNYDNNVELREVILKGRPGNRRVEVPPWNGIDTEGPMGPF